MAILHATKRPCNEEATTSSKGSSLPERGFSSVRPPAPAPGLERDRAQQIPAPGTPLVYMPLSAFLVYRGEVVNARADGRVDIALYKYGAEDSKHRTIDLELSRIEVVASRDKLRPGTCLLDPHDAS